MPESIYYEKPKNSWPREFYVNKSPEEWNREYPNLWKKIGEMFPQFHPETRGRVAALVYDTCPLCSEGSRCCSCRCEEG